MNNECENLDAFLAAELDTVAHGHFEQHLPQCALCRDSIEQDRWLNALLDSPERLKLETPPSSILESFHTSVVRRRQHIRLAACGLAAAASVILAVGWTQLNQKSAAPQAQDAAQNTHAAAVTPPFSQPQATFVGGSNVMVVPIASKSPNVTVVRIYPTYQASANPATDDFNTTEDDLAPPGEFNGG